MNGSHCSNLEGFLLNPDCPLEKFINNILVTHLTQW